MTKILYKYRGISEFTEKIFLKQKIWLSKAEGLNDPFECTIQQIAEDFIKEEVKRMKEAHIMGYVHSTKMNPNPFDKTILKKIRKVKTLNDKHEVVRKAYLKYGNISLSNPVDVFKGFDKQLQNAGIFSLTEDPLNQLMWAHYGQSSQGLAIGFSVLDNNLLGNSDKCLKVNYSNDLPEFSSNGFIQETQLYANGKNKSIISFKDPTFKKAISTKSENWKYEKEWRYVEEKSGEYSFPGEISEIIFGLNMSVENQEKYFDLARNLKTFDKIKFYKIEKVKNKSELELKPAANNV